MGLETQYLQLIKQLEEEKRLADKRVKQIFNLFSPEDWIAPSLLNSWVNYGGAYSIAGYFKDAFGIVHLRGLVKDGTVGQAIFQLPAGYRPAYQGVFVVSSHDGVDIVFGRCDVGTDGNVTAVDGENDYFSLDGITFRIA